VNWVLRRIFGPYREEMRGEAGDDCILKIFVAYALHIIFLG
jgi:hypothetical protein